MSQFLQHLANEALFRAALRESEEQEPKFSPASVQELNSLETFRILADKEDCTICMEKIVSGNEIIRLPCVHEFHRKCVLTWLKKFSSECPICRKSVK